MKYLRICLVLYALLVLVGCSAETFYYRMAAQPQGEGGISFYQGPAPDTALADPAFSDVRNVIYCIGDGMGFNHMALTRHYAKPDNRLWMDLLPVKGQIKTHSANREVTDSAAAGTAMACGIKTNNGMIGMNPEKIGYSSILELLAQKGQRTGLVVTSAVSHATPAAFSAHIDSRNKQKDIALQQVANRVDVMFGGGSKYWEDPTYALAEKEGYTIINSADELRQFTPGPVVGLFADDGLTTFDPEPSLAALSGVAVNLLSAKSSEWFAPDPKFFLMIEGSQIDWAGHANDAERVVRQTLLFDMAVREALTFAERDGHTLVIVTSDHETGGLYLEEDADSEIGVKAKWTTGGHTGAEVPVFAYGPGAEKFAGRMDNTDIPKRIAALTGIEVFPVQRRRVMQTGQK